VHITKATAFAPATVANVAVGFDILGFPVEGVGDSVSVERMDPRPGDTPTVRIESISGSAAGSAGLPLEAGRNTAGIALLRLLRDEALSFGFSLRIRKGIPLSSGMGGSAASSVAALVAVNALLPRPLPPERLLAYALLGEELASGSAHGDNAAPCLYGGLTMLRSLDPVELLRVPLPAGLAVALAHPHMELDTRTSRAALPSELPLKDYVAQSANLASFMASCYTGDLDLMGRCLCDVLVEPRRARLIPAFGAVKRAALKAGALGCSISGSGPSLFALCRNLEDARRAGAAMAAAWEAAGIGVDLWASPVAAKGARLVPEGKEAAP
jgi:homoserine kinase